MTIKIAHTSDLHINERGRLEDTVTVLDAFLEQAKEAEVDVIVLAGDLFERRSTPIERGVLATFLQEASEIAPVFGVKGNHDAAEDLSIFNRLEVDATVMIMDRPTAAPGSARIFRPRGPEGPAIGMIALPWFDKAHLVAGLEATVDAEQTRQMTIAAARDLLICLRAEATRLRGLGAVPILVAHVQVAGSEVASGQTLIGTSVELSPADILEVDAAYSALGHIHMSQEWFEGRVAYSGSPSRNNFGEPDAKGWRLVTLTDAGDFVSNEFRELPARRMVLIDDDLTNIAAMPGSATPRSFITLPEPHEANGALVRYRYRIRSQDLHLFNEDTVRKLIVSYGAHEVRLEAVVEAETRVRSEEITQVTSTADKVDAFWRAKQITVEEPTRDRVRSKLSALEGAA